MMKNIPIFYDTQVYVLIKNGFTLVDMQPNKVDPKRFVYYFAPEEDLKKFLAAEFNYFV